MESNLPVVVDRIRQDLKTCTIAQREERDLVNRVMREELSLLYSLTKHIDLGALACQRMGGEDQLYIEETLRDWDRRDLADRSAVRHAIVERAKMTWARTLPCTSHNG